MQNVLFPVPTPPFTSSVLPLSIPLFSNSSSMVDTRIGRISTEPLALGVVAAILSHDYIQSHVFKVMFSNNLTSCFRCPYGVRDYCGYRNSREDDRLRHRPGQGGKDNTQC